MAIIVEQQPVLLSPGNNYMWFGASRSPAYTNATGYYMRFDVSIGGGGIYGAGSDIFSNNVSIYSAATGNLPLAFFDVHRVIEDNLSYDINQIGLTGWTPSTLIPTVNSFTKYYVWASEYSGATLLNGPCAFTGGTVTAPAGVVATPFYAFNGALSTNIYNAWYFYNYWEDFYLNNGANAIDFLTNWSSPYSVRVNDRHCLSFIQAPTTGSFTTKMECVVTSPNGATNTYTSHNCSTQLGLYYFGSGYLETDNYTWINSTGGSVNNILTINNAVSYTMQLLQGGTPMSQIMEYVVNTETNNIEDIELIWTNQMGGWDCPGHRSNRRWSALLASITVDLWPDIAGTFLRHHQYCWFGRRGPFVAHILD